MNSLGNVTTFQDFTQQTYPQGLFKSHTAVGGETISVVSYSGQRVGQVQRAAPSVGLTEQIAYGYAAPGGDLSSVTLTRAVNGAMTNVRQALYTYYGGGDSNGSFNDLQSAAIQVWNTATNSWQTSQNHYYRYWPTGSSSSSSSSSSGASPVTRLLKYVVNPAAYTRLQNAGINPVTASDAQLAAYADFYFEYDNVSRITLESLGGGKYTYTFAYTAAPPWGLRWPGLPL